VSTGVELPFPGDPFAPRRRPTRVVHVGDDALGGDNPIRIQSMTTTDTQDVAATVAQTGRSQGQLRDRAHHRAVGARRPALGEIRAESGVPLVADIHFTPNAALVAAEHVEKVRINPGNFADKKKFAVLEYSDASGKRWRAAERFRPLCGAASRRARDAHRIITASRPRDEPLRRRLAVWSSGIGSWTVEDEGPHDVVFSMKSSNPLVAIQAYRLLAASLSERARQGRPGDYPFHVGVTEAGDGEDGRIKSAIGIGSLLADGLGDTIRVSLTEDPVKEVPVARAIASRVESLWADAGRSRMVVPDPGAPFVADPFEHARRASASVVSAAIDECAGVGSADAGRSRSGAPADPEARVQRLADAFARAARSLRGPAARRGRGGAERATFAEALAPRVAAPLALRMSGAGAAAQDLGAMIVPVALDATCAFGAGASAGRRRRTGGARGSRLDPMRRRWFRPWSAWGVARWLTRARWSRSRRAPFPQCDCRGPHARAG
jgi:1-hydroxy-2-methyl-2-(E)-butenyl 4-diphosphate synthase